MLHQWKLPINVTSNKYNRDRITNILTINDMFNSWMEIVNRLIIYEMLHQRKEWKSLK